MKKFFFAISLLLISAEVFAQTEKSPFKLNPVADGIILGTGIALTTSAVVAEKTLDFPEYTERSYDLDSVNFLDRKLSQKYSRTLDNFGTATCAVNLALPFAVYGAGFFNDVFSAEDFLTLTTMYVEAYLFDYGAKNFLKMGIQRARPYMYYDGYPKDKLDNHDFEFSSPSGHTTDSFLGAGFLSYTFCRYFPESKWKIPVIAASYTVALGTAALRISSGNHFLTDTIFGAALGTVCGIGVPIVHELIASHSEKKETAFKKGSVRFSVTPVSVNWKIAL
ncbi:phosphatase PAP2 family protein [uncultured Treponema sp.]|uniref:phosphatase PAP2 family protein n=1 Tax=uncultured Treponema sp. TaxID=162155 RepID=UPI0025F30DA7|nr:phosphatase PAP2 family protein [uncultured Treponema sp.]